MELYDFGARNFDPQLGRWHTVDPHCENYTNQSPYNYVMNMVTIAIDPNGMDTHLSGQAAQDFFGQLQKSFSNKNINEIDNMAQSTMQKNGGESSSNFTLDPAKFKTFDINNKEGNKIGVVYSYFDEYKVGKKNEGGAVAGIAYLFGAIITDESSGIKPSDIDWIQRIKTNNLKGESPNEKLNQWYDDQSSNAIAAGGRYYKTKQETQYDIDRGNAHPNARDQSYSYLMWDRPVRLIQNSNGNFITTSLQSNLSLVLVNNNNSSLISFSFGFSVRKGNLTVNSPKVIKTSN